MTAWLPSMACMQTGPMFCYTPCRFISHSAGCAGNRVHPDIFNATKRNGPGGTGHEPGGTPDLFTDSLAIRALICWPAGERSSGYRLYSWLVVCATSPRKKDLEPGVRGHVGAPPGIMEVGPGRGQLLPCPATAARTGDQLPVVDGVLCDLGRSVGNPIPRNDTPFYGVPPHDYSSQQ